MTGKQTFHLKNMELQSLLLEMGEQRSTSSLFSLIVNRLFQFDDVSLVRIWLVKKGDICSSCRMLKECQQRDTCLHLVASAGHSVVNKNEDWSRLNGKFSRFPMGFRKVGHIAASGQPVIVKSVSEDSKWIVDREWTKREGINGFAGHPMQFHGEVLGVLAVFTKSQITQPILDELNIITNHSATALANARAFEKIEELTTQLKKENKYLREELSESSLHGGFIGHSAALQRIVQQIDLVAPTEANVLIQGESGTGKELVARELHRRSNRSSEPLIKVNCASIPKELFASEFFGHAKGAFTGAHTHREGKFGAAHNGTLFLDEVGEIPLELQAQLLRVLQEGEYERVGEEKVRKVNARIIAASNRDLLEEVKAERFREDLYFRLNVFPITVPPLRKRKDDIEPLANHFLQRSLTVMKRPVVQFSSDQLATLSTYNWPGNIRELQNIVERFAISSISESAQLDLTDGFTKTSPDSPETGAVDGDQLLTEEEMVRLQVKNIKRALKRCNGKIYGETGAAHLLGMKPTTLATRIKKMKISR
ncbi:sigma 54-interacting transcriptional regulator [Halodesulfovibrio sp. MK-HDV]|uniref:sigma-54-dependent Fis family transcriptional regulator n=1 Tax=unclassified Halodesulfovibrio TaxID=2644657 RepID=UPI00137097C8|nr:sigma 54-interacting transcriptional regulator [Halodesulfovibrio sp. MK-HDV]KAF1076313.1 DNA-binding transcriptional activator HyfR [Halodesulfovibrio sp. MK-HDV]